MEMLNKLENTTRNLLQTLSSFRQENINLIPFEGSWTAAQVAEHLRMSNGFIAALLCGTMKPANRPPDQNIARIKAAFLNFDIKMESPDFILPKPGPYDQEKLVSAMEAIMTKISEGAQTLDLSATHVDLAFPVLGELTRLEMIWFVIYHTQRHTHQLKNILQALNAHYA